MKIYQVFSIFVMILLLNKLLSQKVRICDLPFSLFWPSHCSEMGRRHGKNCTNGSVYTYSEKQKDKRESGWGGTAARLGKDSIKVNIIKKSKQILSSFIHRLLFIIVL